jgi:hypothetical protein
MTSTGIMGETKLGTESDSAGDPEHRQWAFVGPEHRNQRRGARS